MAQSVHPAVKKHLGKTVPEKYRSHSVDGDGGGTDDSTSNSQGTQEAAHTEQHAQVIAQVRTGGRSVCINRLYSTKDRCGFA